MNLVDKIEAAATTIQQTNTITKERVEKLRLLAASRRPSGFVMGEGDDGAEGTPFPISIPADEFVLIANLALKSL